MPQNIFQLPPFPPLSSPIPTPPNLSLLHGPCPPLLPAADTTEPVPQGQGVVDVEQEGQDHARGGNQRPRSHYGKAKGDAAVKKAEAQGKVDSLHV